MSLIKETGRALMKLGISSFFRIKQEDFVLKFYPTKISLVLWVDSLRSQASYQAEDKFLRSYLCPNDVVIDVGANIGFLSLISAVVVGRKGKVYSIEAHPKIFKYLLGNIAVNNIKHICAYNLAIGDKNGTVCFSDKERDDRNEVVNDDCDFQVTIAKLDDMGIIDECIALLKIDVEGYEKFVLKGASKLLQRVQCIMFESKKEHYRKYGYSFCDIFEFLAELGFTIYKFEDDFIVQVQENYQSEKCENLIAVRSIDEFSERTHYSLRKN